MTMDYSKWPMKVMSITNLCLDPENPRIPATGSSLSQRELIAELVLHDNVYDLAKSMAENGYFPNEVVVTYVNKADRNRYVVEGNRRVAAVKCLLSPDAAPDDFQSKFRKLAADIDAKAIGKVHVLTAPSRKAAIPLLLDRHTHEQIERWSRPMQAQFLRRLQEEGMSIEQIAAWSRKTAADVRKLITASLLYRAACSLDLDEKTKAKVTNRRTFPLTTLERAFESKPVCQFLGIEKDDSKLLKGKAKRSEFTKAFKKIVTDTAGGDINTRSLNTAQDIKKYLATFGDAKPDLAKKGRFEISQLAKGSTRLKPAAKRPAAKKKTPRPSQSVIPTIIKCSCASKRINDVFAELKRLRLDRYPNASAVLLRTLIDLCVCNYLENTKEMKNLLAKHQGKGKKKDWAPSLHQMLNYLLNEVDCGLEGAAHTALQTFNTARRTTLCLDGLDKFTHNRYTPPEPDGLRNMWTMVEPLMEIVLVDPV